METAKGHNKLAQDLDEEINSLEKQIKDSGDGPKNDPDSLIAGIEEYIKENGDLNQDKMLTLFSHVIKDMYEKFDHIAEKNGIKLEGPDTGDAS